MIPIILGTRGSPLALAQTRLVMAQLKRAWPTRTFEIHIIKTEGDRRSENPGAVDQPLDKGLFTAELERALRSRKIHIAVHSLKDMPTDEPEGLVIGAVPLRADARDLLITRGPVALSDLPPDARIATGSPRRSAQLSLARPDLQIVPIRGNIDTRIRKFREDENLSALILAAAGLQRLRFDTSGLTTEPLPFYTMLPAPGQGALALQTRADAGDILLLLKAVNDPVTAAAVAAERMFLHALGGGCQEPVAAYAEVQGDDMLRLRVIAWIYNETKPRRGIRLGKIAQAVELGTELAVEISR